MTLRQRTLLSVALTLAFLMAVVYVVSARLVLQNHENLERQEINRNLRRVGDELAYQIDEMHANASDWSNWDDTYQFMADKNATYVKSNLNAVLLNLDIMLFIDSQGRMFHEYRIRREGHATPPKGEDLRAALGLNGHGKKRDLTKDFSGIVQLKNGDAILVSVRPIVKTNGEGSPRGCTVFGLRLDSVEMARLAERSHLALDLFPMEGGTLPADCVQALQKGVARGDLFSQPIDEKTVAGYVSLKTVDGVPAKLLRVRESRSIYAQGLASQRTLMQFITGAGIVFSLVILWLLEVAALSRVSRLSNQVLRVATDGDEASRVSLPGKDELSWLARVIDGMIQRLRESKLEIAAKNQNLEETVLTLAATNHILANAVEGIAQFDADDRIVNVNSAFAELYDYDSNSLTGLHWQALIAPEDHDRIKDAITHMVLHEKSQCEVRGRRRDGSLFFAEIVIVAAHDSENRIASSHWFTKDISERKKLECQVQFQAFHDPLTGLPNRALFVDRLRMACQRATRKGDSIAVLFLDLDEFKVINDCMGHEAGDHLLVGVASRLQRCVRPQDTVARLGGDEFTVLLDGLGKVEEAVQVAQRMLAAMESPISLPTGKAFAGASIGIAFSTGGEHDSTTLLRDADVAMYQAKGLARSSFAVFEPIMNAPGNERRELAAELRVALETDKLSLHYQPLVQLATGKTVGIEALLRWQDERRGEVPPNLFISVAEEMGMMDALGTWSLRQACRQMKEWLDTFADAENLTMGVNLSGKQLQRSDLVETVASALDEFRLPPEKLRLEIAAKLLAGDADRVIKILQRLKETGVKLALDDFGTGSHLISNLREYPFDMVKIDGSVTWLIETHDEARALVQAMLIMAKSAKVEVAAEGIETYAQIQHLRKFGCSAGQGYIFGRPLPANELGDLLATGMPMQLSSGEAAA
jgi:diguanylate cyclase (GGDEF)-like protein/PAS domain S-box-containing protein